MRRYSEDLIIKAKELRERDKLSFREIAKIINVSAGTVGTWVGGVVGNKWDGLILFNERKRGVYKEAEIGAVPDFHKITKNQAKLFAGLLYGCEGSKYPSHRGVAFANSEPGLIVAFLKLLRKGFEMQENKFSVHLQIHSNQNFPVLKKYWSRLLSIKEAQFMKPTITVATGKKHRDNYVGTCTLRYGDYSIQLKLLGIFEKFLEESSKKDV